MSAPMCCSQFQVSITRAQGDVTAAVRRLTKKPDSAKAKQALAESQATLERNRRLAARHADDHQRGAA